MLKTDATLGFFVGYQGLADVVRTPLKSQAKKPANPRQRIVRKYNEMKPLYNDQFS